MEVENRALKKMKENKEEWQHEKLPSRSVILASDLVKSYKSKEKCPILRLATTTRDKEKESTTEYICTL